MAKKQAVSPAASGGAGTLFEYRVAAIMLTHLLRGTHPPGLLVPVVGVGLQQRVRGHLLDDIVVYGEAPPSSLCTEFQVKRSLTVTAGDEAFVDVITQALHRLSERREDAPSRSDLGLGLIAEGQVGALDQLAELTRYARGHAAHQTFADVFAKGVVDEKLRARLRDVQAAVALVLERGVPDLGGVDLSAHALLSVMHVWRPSAGDGGSDFLAALDRLTPIAESFDVRPIDLFGHLAGLAESWGPVAGVVDADSLLRQLRRRGLRAAGPSGSALVGTSNTIDADAVVRGPIDSLGLQGEVAEAERLLAAGDAEAAIKFASIVTCLEAARFLPHATIMRRRQADALQAIGRDDDAVIMRIGMAWEGLDADRPWDWGFALHDGRRPGVQESIQEATERARAAADMAVQVAKGGDLDRFVTAFDRLAGNDPYLVRAAVFLCEEAIADAQPGLLLDRMDLLGAIATEASHTEDDHARRCAARIQMCLADASGQWIDLLREVHRRYPRPIVAWLHARYARHLALSGDGAGAQEHYLEAIERACMKEMFDEAADWLYAWRTVLYWYEDSLKDEQHPLAQALRPHAKPSTLPGSPYTAERALRAMQDADKPDTALQAVRRWRWQAVIRGQFTEEIEALETFGTLLQRQDDADNAIKCLVRAGSDRAAQAARSLPERTARLDLGMLTSAPPCRAAAYSAATAAADLLTDDDARAWGDAALAEVMADQPLRSFGPSPGLSAFDLLAAVCDALSDEQAEQLLRLVEPLIERPANHYKHTDKAVARILVTLAASRPEAIPLLARALVADQRMAEVILKRPDVLVASRDAVAQLLTPFAAGNRYACLAIIRAGADPAPALDLAKTEEEQELAPRQHQPGLTLFYAGAPETALLASVLGRETRTRFARTMLERALDRREVTYSRWNDLAGLANIASEIDEDTQASLLPQVLEIARGQHDGGPADDSAGGTGTLSDLALTCAANLNPTPAQCVEIEQIGMAYLRDADEPAQWRISQALVLLPAGNSSLDLWQCAVHPLAALRALSAVRWAADPATLPQENAELLARDDDPRVRRALARALRSNQRPIEDGLEEIAGILAADVRRSVRHLAGSPT